MILTTIDIRFKCKTGLGGTSGSAAVGLSLPSSILQLKSEVQISIVSQVFSFIGVISKPDDLIFCFNFLVLLLILECPKPFVSTVSQETKSISVFPLHTLGTFQLGF